MMSQTTTEKLTLERQLQRIERANPDHFRFPRHSGRHERTLPLVEHAPEIKDAVIGAAIFAALIGALATAPWWA